jgi:hypothetical protein
MSDLSFHTFAAADRAKKSAGDIVRGAMSRLGLIDVDRTLTAAEMDFGIDTLNGILETWSLESLSVYSTGEVRFKSIGGKRKYLVGVGEYIDAERPSAIASAKILQDAARFQPIQVVGYEWPEASHSIYYNPTFPAGELTLNWDSADEQIALIVNQELRRYDLPTDEQNLPIGHARALELALVVDLAPSFGVTVSKEILNSLNIAQNAIRKQAALLRLRPATTGLGKLTGSRFYGGGNY